MAEPAETQAGASAVASGPSYRKLPGTGYRRIVPGWALVLLFFIIGIFVFLLRGRRVQLWAAHDHLLLVEWDGYREYYKRFRYEDVQVLLMQQTRESYEVSALLGFVAIILAVIGFTATEPAVQITLLVIGALLAVLVLVNLLLGPTCRCWLKTAVQQEELASLRRVRTARRVFEQLRSAIVAAQGQLEPAKETTQAQGDAGTAGAGVEHQGNEGNEGF